MLAFHGKQEVKDRYLARVAEHARLDEIVQGTGYEKNGAVRACAVGCTLDAYDHKRYPIELGLPVWLAYLEDSIHEGLRLAQAKKWPARFLTAIAPGADVEPVRWQLTILRMERLLPDLVANKEPYARECEAAVRGVIKMAQGFLKEGFSESAARSALSAALSATWSALSAARSAAESAAWSATWSAQSAAWSATWSVARSAAWSATWSVAGSAAGSARSAWSAARSAESAAWSATWSAESAWTWEANTLLKLLRACKPS